MEYEFGEGKKQFARIEFTTAKYYASPKTFRNERLEGAYNSEILAIYTIDPDSAIWEVIKDRYGK